MITTILLLFFTCSIIFGIIGLVLKITGKLVNGVLKIIFHPNMFLLAVLVMAYIYFAG